MRHFSSRRFRLSPGIDANIRGALTLGTLLMFIFVVAFLGAFRIYRQLDAAVNVERTLVKAERQLSEVLRAQLDEENGLRGFLATNQREFLDPFLAEADAFEKRIGALGVTTAPLGIAEFTPLLDEMRSLHSAWEKNVARPLLAAPKANDAVVRQTLGKVLVDRMRSDVSHADELLNARLIRAQNDLRRRIDETVGDVLASIMLFGVLGIIYVGSRTRMLARIGRERAIIETLQGAFRTGWDVPPGLRVGTSYISATADAGVGGDLFDVCKLNDTKALLLVADVSGKGIEAAVNTAFIKYSIRMLARMGDDPARILSEFNHVFIETIKEPNLFVSAFVGVIDAHAMTMDYASGGHSSTYMRCGSDVRQLPVTGPVIGIDRNVSFSAQTVKLVPSDMLVLATDGLTEARNGRGKQLEDEGAMLLVASAPSDPQACADELVAAVRKHSGGTLRDDLALLVVSVDAPERMGK